MDARCYECARLKMEEGEVPPNWVLGKYYTCSAGRFSLGKTYQRWFAWSGIVKPNKTVAIAQKDCPSYKQN